MDTLTPAERDFMKLQHRFRGLVANFKSRRPMENGERSPVKVFRSDLAALYLDMRDTLGTDKYRQMLEWVSEQVNGQLAEIVNLPVMYEEVGGIHVRSPSVSLNKEIAWISERLRLNRDRLAFLCDQSNLIQERTLAGDYGQAIDLVRLIQDGLGVSVWSVQLRLALEQQLGGLETQKRYSAVVRAVHSRGMRGGSGNLHS